MAPVDLSIRTCLLPRPSLMSMTVPKMIVFAKRFYLLIHISISTQTTYSFWYGLFNSFTLTPVMLMTSAERISTTKSPTFPTLAICFTPKFHQQFFFPPLMFPNLVKITYRTSLHPPCKRRCEACEPKRFLPCRLRTLRTRTIS